MASHLSKGVLAAALSLALWLPAKAGAERATPHIESGDLDESSGLTRSKVHEGVFWSHNDSGGAPELFALDVTGKDLGRVSITGAPLRDWEDITTDDDGHLWIHDGGNNKNKRRDLTVIRVSEPPSLSGEVAADRLVRFHFPEQTAFPPPKKNFDSEALFWDEGRLMLLTKHRADTSTVLYVFPAGFEADPAWAPGSPAPPASLPLQKLGAFDVGGDMDNYGGKVTAADVSPDGKHLAVLTYHALFVFERPATGGDWLSGAHRRISLVQLFTQQCEALAWDGGALVITNEGRAVMRIAEPLAPGCKTFPGPGCASRR